MTGTFDRRIMRTSIGLYVTAFISSTYNAQNQAKCKKYSSICKRVKRLRWRLSDTKTARLLRAPLERIIFAVVIPDTPPMFTCGDLI